METYLQYIYTSHRHVHFVGHYWYAVYIWCEDSVVFLTHANWNFDQDICLAIFYAKAAQMDGAILVVSGLSQGFLCSVWYIRLGEL